MKYQPYLNELELFKKISEDFAEENKKKSVR